MIIKIKNLVYVIVESFAIINKDCCYLKSKDINIVQINDPEFFQGITSYNNLHLTAKEPDINTVDIK